MKPASISISLCLALALPLTGFCAALPPVLAPAVQAKLAKGGTKAEATQMMKEAKGAFDAGKMPQAASWMAASRWVGFFGDAGDCMRPELKAWLLSKPDLSWEFFSMLGEADKPAKVGAILDAIYGKSPKDFERYSRLAMAIAIVHDEQPPSSWPHHQVSDKLLSRRFPDPTQTFSYFADADRKGQLLYPLERMGIDELVFVVDAVAPIDQLEGARKRAKGDLSKLYSSVSYRHDRLKMEGGVFWQESDGAYSLENILKKGGICVDQAYYMSQSCKAVGVPSIIFSGAGGDGRHAWVGFMQKSGKWDTGVGRYAEQRYVVGQATDPQTWRTVNDFKIAFLSERFRGTDNFRDSMLCVNFGTAALDAGNAKAALALARRAVSLEKRNVDGWRLLCDATEKADSGDSACDAACTEAFKALTRYADLETEFRMRLANAYEKRGDKDKAAEQISQIIRRNSDDRPDIALDMASKRMRALMQADDAKTAQRDFSRLIMHFRDNGVTVWDSLIKPYLDYLVQNKRFKDANSALSIAEKRLKVEKDSQLKGEMDKIREAIKAEGKGSATPRK